jgi:hypothetical protein
MATQQGTQHVNGYIAQPQPPKLSIIGLLFFLLGTPHLYSFWNRRQVTARSGSASYYAKLALIAGAIAAILEFSLLVRA